MSEPVRNLSTAAHEAQDEGLRVRRPPNAPAPTDTAEVPIAVTPHPAEAQALAVQQKVGVVFTFRSVELLDGFCRACAPESEWTDDMRAQYEPFLASARAEMEQGNPTVRFFDFTVLTAVLNAQDSSRVGRVAAWIKDHPGVVTSANIGHLVPLLENALEAVRALAAACPVE